MAKAKTSSGKTSKASGKGTGRPTGSKNNKKKDTMTSRPSQDKKNFTSKKDTSTRNPDLKRSHYTGTEEQRRLGQARPKDFKAKRATKKAEPKKD